MSTEYCPRCNRELTVHVNVTFSVPVRYTQPYSRKLCDDTLDTLIGSGHILSISYPQKEAHCPVCGVYREGGWQGGQVPSEGLSG